MNPLLRFNAVLIATVLLLALSLGQVYRWYGSEPAPVVDAEYVLQAVEQLQHSHRSLQCQMDNGIGCGDALFVEYPAGYWGGKLDEAQVFAMRDKQGRQMLCRHSESDKILCINNLKSPDKLEHGLDLAYVFYLALFLVIFLLSRNLFRDIEILRRSAISEIKFGKFPAFSLSPKSYLAPLAQSLRNMTANIEQLNQFQAEVAETVCHDIKTPLARIKFLSHLMTADNLDTSRQQLNNNIADIEDNIYDYLSLAENEYSEVGNERTELELGAFIKDLLAQVPADNDIAIELQLPAPISAWLYSNLMKRLVNNLLGNALRFAKSRVLIRCERQGQHLLLAVEDDGPGWDAAEGSGGDGQLAHHKLGLSIVRRVVEKHQGQIRLQPSSLGGAKVLILLPLITQ
ncbi:sensor histidine kinase [Shewanella cyperi]|nr:ATP-binding protein [Shewanella cyperi]